MVRTIDICGKKITLRASALIPRLYRFQFGRDMVADMRKLERAYRKAASLPADASEEQRLDAQLSIADLTIFEDVAFLMAKQGGSDIPDTPEEWLDSIDGVFSLYEVMPVLLDLWGANLKTTAIPKKKRRRRP